MQINNQGTIKVPEQYSEILGSIAEYLCIYNPCIDDNIDEYYSTLEIEISGDIENELNKIVDSCGTLGIPIKVDIKYFGDYNGEYFVEKGKLVCFNEYQMMLSSATPDDLVSELERKGYEVSIKKK